MPEDMIRPLAEYGILAMGWIVCGILWRRLITVEDRLAKALEDNTKAMTELSIRIGG